MKKLFRSKKDRVFGGVCGGIGEYFNVDPNLVRVIAVIAGICAGILPAIFVYLAAVVLIPENPE